MSKGSKRRPQFVSDAEYSLRYDLAMGKITSAEYGDRIKTLRRAEQGERK